MEQYLYISFKDGFRGWYRDPDELSGLGDLVYAPILTNLVLGEVILVQRMTTEDARFFYPARIKRIYEVYEKYENRPEEEKDSCASLFQKTRTLFEQHPECFAFRI